MSTLRRIFLPATLALSLLTYGLALADAGATEIATSMSSDTGAVPSGRAGLAMVILVCLSWALRTATKKSSGRVAAFIHSTAGAAVSGLLSSVIPGLIQALQHGWNLQALEAALVSGSFAYFAVDNVSNTSDEQRGKVAAMRDTSAKVGVLLPILFIAVAGCAHLSPSERAFGNSFAACMETRGLAAAPSVGAEAWSDLTNGTSVPAIEAQLEALAGRAGVDSVTCAVQAWLAPAAPAELNPAGVAAGKVFLKRHSATTKTDWSVL